MFATIRRYEGVDADRIDEVVGNVNEKLMPKLRELSGFAGYHLIQAENGVLSSFTLFESREQADVATKLAATWITDEHLEKAIPNAPRITSGRVVVQSDPVLATV